MAAVIWLTHLYLQVTGLGDNLRKKLCSCIFTDVQESKRFWNTRKHFLFPKYIRDKKIVHAISRKENVDTYFTTLWQLWQITFCCLQNAKVEKETLSWWHLLINKNTLFLAYSLFLTPYFTSTNTYLHTISWYIKILLLIWLIPLVK